MLQMLTTIKNIWHGRFIAHLRVPLYRNGYALILSAIVTSGLGLLYWVLAARYYKPEIVGLNAAAISIMTFLSGVSRLNLDGVLYRFIPRAGGSTRALIQYSYLISQTLAALVSIIFLIGVDLWSPALSFIKTNVWLSVWFVLMTMSLSLFTLQDSVLTGLRQTMWVPLENLLFAIGKIALLLLFVRLFPQYGIFSSFTIPVVVMTVPVNYLIFCRLVPRHMEATLDLAEPIGRGQIIKYTSGVYLGYLFSTATAGILPLMVLQRLGSIGNAYFYFPWLIGSSLQLVSQNMNVSLTVEGALDQTKLHAYTRRVLIQMARLLLPMVLILLFGAPYILRAFGGDYANEGAWLLRLLALATIPHVINNVYIGIARVTGRIAAIMAIQGFVCVSTLSLSYALLSFYGITGIGIAWLSSQTCIAMVVMFSQLRPLLWAIQSRSERKPN